MTQKEFFKSVNTMAQADFNRALGMLDTYNLLHGTAFFFNNKRVVYKRYENGVEHLHDAYTNADGKGRFWVVGAKRTNGAITVMTADNEADMEKYRDALEDDDHRTFILYQA